MWIYNSCPLQADKQRAALQREFMQQQQRAADEAEAAAAASVMTSGGDQSEGESGAYESSEPTSMTNSSTVEGEHTIQVIKVYPSFFV